MPPKTILLTGATGFLGSHLLEAFIAEGYSVVVLKRSTSDTWRINCLKSHFAYYDVDKVDLRKVFSENAIDLIVHLATLYKKFEEPEDIESMMLTNISFPSKLLVLGMKNGVKGFINTGTFFEYDCSLQPVNEQAPTKTFNFYAKTKLAFESILKTYSSELCINTFKLFSPFGERDNKKLVPLIINYALSGKELKLSEGLQKIDLIYCKDIVLAYLKSVKRMFDSDFQPEWEVFNLGSGQALSIRDIVSVIEQLLGKRVDISWGAPSRDIRIAYADTTKLHSVLEWSPSFGVKKGLENTIKYYRKEMRNGNN